MGANRESEPRPGEVASIIPQPVESAAIESAVQKAKRPRATMPMLRSWIDASSRAGGAVAAGRDQRRHGGEVVGVGRVAETQYDRDDDHQRQRRPVREMRDPGVESEHVNSLSGGRARSWQDQRPG